MSKFGQLILIDQRVMNLASKFIDEFVASVKHRVRELQAIPRTAFCKVAQQNLSFVSFLLRFLMNI